MFGGNIGITELILIAMVALLLFGGRLPKVMRSLGQGIVEFKKGVRGIEDDIDDASTRRRELPAASKSAEQAQKKEETTDDFQG